MAESNTPKKYLVTRGWAERVFWTGFLVGLIWGHLLVGITLGLWIA